MAALCRPRYFQDMKPAAGYNTQGWMHFILRLVLLSLVMVHVTLSAQAPAKNRGAVRDVLREDSYSVFPNPSSGKFTVSVKDLDRHFGINIYNLIGELVFRWESPDTGPTEIEVNLTKQPRGLYFVELDTDRGNLLKKIVVESDKGS
jgi:hypothetical protein